MGTKHVNIQNVDTEIQNILKTRVDKYYNLLKSFELNGYFYSFMKHGI